MDEKPKRKRGQDPNEIDFITALTVEECLERLERGPARTLDYRLTVRTDGARFKVEVLGNTGNARASMKVLAEMDGYLQPWKTSHLRPGINVTRVTAHSNTRFKPGNSDLPFIICVPLSISYAYVLATAIEGETGLCVGFLVVVAGVIFSAVWSSNQLKEVDKTNRQIPDLHQWLMQQIYEPPGLPEE